jgi:membrane protein implicated in regulation of membrane protease activity
MADTTMWWVLAGGAVALELASGTFYLLMLAVGLAAGAVAAHLGLGPTEQMLAVAVIGGGSVLAWRSYRQRSGANAPLKAEANPDVNLDIGGTVQVDAWQPDGTASVHYRGATWTVAWQTGQAGTAPSPGQHRIVAVSGSRLIVERNP